MWLDHVTQTNITWSKISRDQWYHVIATRETRYIAWRGVTMAVAVWSAHFTCCDWCPDKLVVSVSWFIEQCVLFLETNWLLPPCILDKSIVTHTSCHFQTSFEVSLVVSLSRQETEQQQKSCVFHTNRSALFRLGVLKHADFLKHIRFEWCYLAPGSYTLHATMQWFYQYHGSVLCRVIDLCVF